MTEYCACCNDCDDVIYCGVGKTPDEAFSDFINKGDFHDYCDGEQMLSGTEVDVFIYTTVSPQDSDWDEDEINPDWLFVLAKKIETRKLTFVLKTT